MPNYNQTLQTNNSSLEEIITQLNNMPDAGGSANPVLQDKTVTPTTAKQTVTADSGYDGLDTVTVNAMPTATQATPTVSINSSTGLITATATQSAGYVGAGTKSGTLQLAFQAAQTITPGTTNKTIAANTYLGGVQTIKGDANLVASNIVSGKSIFGVVGTATTGGGDTSLEDAFVTGTLSSTYTNDRVTKIGDHVFVYNTTLQSVDFPAVTSIGKSAFGSCKYLKSINFPLAETIGVSAFCWCEKLTEVSFSQVTTISSNAFLGCSGLLSATFPKVTIVHSRGFAQCAKLTTINFPTVRGLYSGAFTNCYSLASVSLPSLQYMSSFAFASCTRLTSIYLGRSSVCSLLNSNAFQYTSITSSTGSIFVPESLVAAYQSASQWSYFSARIFPYTFT